MFFRRVRGLVGTAVTWGGAWALIGLGVGAAFWITGATVFSRHGPSWMLVWAEVGAFNGAISGAVFALAVMVSERRRQLDAIGALRFGILGAVTTGGLVALSGAPLPTSAICSALGFLTGSGSAVVARRALPRSQAERSLPPAA